MKISNFLLLSLSLVLILGVHVESFKYQAKELESEKGLRGMYDRWRKHHNVVEVSDKEKSYRFNIFKENARHVHQTNKMKKAYKLKLNKFADMSNHEFTSMYSASKVSHFRALQGGRKSNMTFMYQNSADIPPSIDWRTRNAVTPAKNQGKCGGCWAFSTVVAVEGINAIKTGQLVSLSEQQLIDCETKTNNGCNGGLMEPAFMFIKEHGGLAMEQNYPYTARRGICDPVKIEKQVVMIDGYEDVPECDENALMKAVAHQPVSVAIEAKGHDLQFYSKGVFTGQCGVDVDHAVAIVGYDQTPDGMKYWIVKNSWGPEWGENGFIRMLRGVDDIMGLCGIAIEASYPVMNSNTPINMEL